jgi:hypothetical protein
MPKAVSATEGHPSARAFGPAAAVILPAGPFAGLAFGLSSRLSGPKRRRATTAMALVRTLVKELGKLTP